MKTDLLCCFDELFVENLGLILESVCLSLIAEETFCTVGRVDMVEEKVVEVFRRHHDGDPMEIEKNACCSSDVWLDRHCLQASLLGAKEMFVQG